MYDCTPEIPRLVRFINTESGKVAARVEKGRTGCYLTCSFSLG
jgi:hypothetical protein